MNILCISNRSARSLDLRDRAAQRFTRIRHAYEVLSDEALGTVAWCLVALWNTKTWVMEFQGNT